MPNFNLAADTCREVSAGGSEFERCDGASKGEMIQSDSTWEVRQDSSTVFVDGEKQVTVRVEG